MASEGITNDHTGWKFHDHDVRATGPASKTDLTESYHGIKNFVVHPDSTVTRPVFELVPAKGEFVQGVASKDITVDEEMNLWARIYIPDIILTSDKKLPVVLYFHGGGFVCLSVHARMIHDYCELVCRSTSAMIVSVEYRKAPEHRIPAQYEDAYKALKWLQSQALLQRGDEGNRDSTHAKAGLEPWLNSHAEFKRCFTMGDSAGGNIVHHLCVRTAFEDIHPLQLCGQILLQPGVGGMDRTPAELYWGREKSLSLRAVDTFWNLALPKDADLNHPACHVFPQLAELTEKKISLPDTLLVVGGQDLLQDWQRLFYEAQERSTTKIRYIWYDDAIHGFNLTPSNKWTNPFLTEIKHFINSSSTTTTVDHKGLEGDRF